MLVNNTNLYPILHHFLSAHVSQIITFDGLSLFYSLNRGESKT